jgi:hypothetical protein
MAGKPWEQVQYALYHIMENTLNNQYVKTEVITYDGRANSLDFKDLTFEEIKKKIKNISAGK